MSKKSDDSKIIHTGSALVLLGLLGVGVAAMVKPTQNEDDWETAMLPPGKAPDGAGWVPMDAVSHTSIYGGLMGKPQARVVWKRRKQVERSEPEARFPMGFPWLRNNT